MSRLVPWLSSRGTEQKKKKPLRKGKNEKKYEKNEKQKQVPYTIWYRTPVVKTPSGGGSYLNDQSAGSGYHDLGPQAHAGHDREVYRHFHRLIIAGLQNHSRQTWKLPTTYFVWMSHCLSLIFFINFQGMELHARRHEYKAIPCPAIRRLHFSALVVKIVPSGSGKWRMGQIQERWWDSGSPVRLQLILF